MDTKEFKLEKELVELKHKNKMEEIEAEKQAHIEVENLKSENMKSLHRLKRADRKREFSDKQDFNY